jgi:hypothetical protein
MIKTESLWCKLHNVTPFNLDSLAAQNFANFTIIGFMRRQPSSISLQALRFYISLISDEFDWFNSESSKNKTVAKCGSLQLNFTV